MSGNTLRKAYSKNQKPRRYTVFSLNDGFKTSSVRFLTPLYNALPEWGKPIYDRIGSSENPYLMFVYNTPEFHDLLLNTSWVPIGRDSDIISLEPMFKAISIPSILPCVIDEKGKWSGINWRNWITGSHCNPIQTFSGRSGYGPGKSPSGKVFSVPDSFTLQMNMSMIICFLNSIFCSKDIDSSTFKLLIMSYRNYQRIDSGDKTPIDSEILAESIRHMRRESDEAENFMELRNTKHGTVFWEAIWEILVSEPHLINRSSGIPLHYILMSLTLRDMKVDFDSCRPVIVVKILEHVLGKAAAGGGLENFVDDISLSMHIINKSGAFSKIRWWVFFTMIVEFMVKNPSSSSETLTDFSVSLRDNIQKIDSCTGLLTMLLNPKDSAKLTDLMMAEMIYHQVHMKKPISTELFYGGGLEGFKPVEIHRIIKKNIDAEKKLREENERKAAAIAKKMNLSRKEDSVDFTYDEVTKWASEMNPVIELEEIMVLSGLPLAGALHRSKTRGLFNKHGNVHSDRKVRKAGATSCWRSSYGKSAARHGFRKLYLDIQAEENKGKGIHTSNLSRISRKINSASGYGFQDRSVPIDQAARDFIWKVLQESSIPSITAECIVCMDDIKIESMSLLHGGIHPGTYICKVCEPRVLSELDGVCPMCRGNL